MSKKVIKKININYIIYARLKRDLLRNKSLDPESFLFQASMLARFATNYFNGLVSDLTLEKVIAKRGHDHFGNQVTEIIPKENRVLHIATELYSTGGHTKQIANWITVNQSKEHFVYCLAEKKNTPVLSPHFERKITFSNKRGRLEKAEDLLSFIKKCKPQFIVLHIHMYDPIFTFISRLFSGVKILLYNHADHLFTLGIEPAIATIEFRKKSIEISKNHRGKHAIYLPFIYPDSTDSKAEHLESSENVFVVMARAGKLRKNKSQDFFKTWSQILQKRNDFVLHVIGVGELDWSKTTTALLSSQIVLHGTVVNPNEILRKARYSVESFPNGSAMSTIDQLRLGLLPVWAYKSLCIYGHSAAKDMTTSPVLSYKTEDEYIDFVSNIDKNTLECPEFVLSTTDESFNCVFNFRDEDETYKNDRLISAASVEYAQLTTDYSFTSLAKVFSKLKPAPSSFDLILVKNVSKVYLRLKKKWSL